MAKAKAMIQLTCNDVAKLFSLADRIHKFREALLHEHYRSRMVHGVFAKLEIAAIRSVIEAEIADCIAQAAEMGVEIVMTPTERSEAAHIESPEVVAAHRAPEVK